MMPKQKATKTLRNSVKKRNIKKELFKQINNSMQRRTAGTTNKKAIFMQGFSTLLLHFKLISIKKALSNI